MIPPIRQLGQDSLIFLDSCPCLLFKPLSSTKVEPEREVV